MLQVFCPQHMQIALMSHVGLPGIDLLLEVYRQETLEESTTLKGGCLRPYTISDQVDAIVVQLATSLSASACKECSSLSPLFASHDMAIAHLPYILHMHISSNSCAGHIHAQDIQELPKQGCNTSLTSCTTPEIRPSHPAFVDHLDNDHMPCRNRCPIP